MAASTVNRDLLILVTNIFLLLLPHDVYGSGKSSKKNEAPTEPPVEIRVVTELQDKYNGLTAPALIMLPVVATSPVAPELTLETEKELLKQLVDSGKVKPILMQKWLNSTFGNTRSNNPFLLMNSIKAEQYVMPVQYIGKSTIFKSGIRNFFLLNIYPLNTYYPVTIFRIFYNEKDLPEMVSSCIEEMNIRLFQTTANDSRKRIIIDDFKLELLKLVELPSGEFEFISAPFIERSEMTIRENDDFFSRILGYVLSTTGLFRVMLPGDFKDYANATITGGTANNVDYRIQGRVQLSEKECVLYVNVQDIRTGAVVNSIRYPLLDYSLNNVWNTYRIISVSIISKIYDQSVFGIVPPITSANDGFFANNQFIGWDSLENIVLTKGFHKISTGSFNKSNDIPSKTYYVLLDTINEVYTGRNGEHIGNLLNKP